MKKKWIKRSLVLGALLAVAYLFTELFLIDFLAERRYLNDKQEMNDILKKNKDAFDYVRTSSNSLPSYELSMKEKGKIILNIYLDILEPLTDNSQSSNYYNYYSPSFEQGAVDTFINETKWSIYINNAKTDSAFYNGMKIFRWNQNHFLEISKSAEKIGSTYISNDKNLWLRILYKETYNEELQYISPNFDISQIPKQDISYMAGDKIDDYFFCNHFIKNGLFCGYYSTQWLIPE